MVKSGESWRFDAIRGLKNIVVVVVGLCLETNVDLISMRLVESVLGYVIQYGKPTLNREGMTTDELGAAFTGRLGASQ